MRERTSEEIARIMRDGNAIDRSLVAAYRRTVLRHRQHHVPLVVWQDGAVVEVSADDVELPPVPDGAAEPTPSR